MKANLKPIDAPIFCLAGSSTYPIRINLGRCHARSRKFGEKNKRPPIVRYDRVFCRNKNHTKQKEAA